MESFAIHVPIMGKGDAASGVVMLFWTGRFLEGSQARRGALEGRENRGVQKISPHTLEPAMKPI